MCTGSQTSSNVSIEHHGGKGRVRTDGSSSKHIRLELSVFCCIECLRSRTDHRLLRTYIYYRFVGKEEGIERGFFKKTFCGCFQRRAFSFFRAYGHRQFCGLQAERTLNRFSSSNEVPFIGEWITSERVSSRSRNWPCWLNTGCRFPS